MNKISLCLSLVLLSHMFCHAQVSLVKDINPGALDGITSEFLFSKNKFVALNNKLVFIGNSSVDNYQIWSSDGTEANTFQIHEFGEGFTVTQSPLMYRAANNKIYFNVINELDMSIYITDGTTNGLIDATPTQVSYMNNAIEINDMFVFEGFFYSINEEASGPHALLDTADFNLLYQIDQNSEVELHGLEEPVVLNNTVFYNCNSISGEHLCSSEFGNGPPVSKVFNIDSQYDSYPSGMTVFNNKVYFSAYTSQSGIELWVTDGTHAGTHIVLDMKPGIASSIPENIIVYNNELYFTADHPSLGIELFKMDTSETITNLKNISFNSLDSSPSELTVYNGSLYFAANNVENGIELWKTEGLESNTILLKDINANLENSSSPHGFVEYNGELYFNADDGINGRELWKTNGTNAGTVLVENINPFFLDSDPSNLTVVGDDLYFSAITSATGRELFKYRDASLTLNTVQIEDNFRLSPNPTNDYFSIANPSEITNLTIFDIQGKQVKTFNTIRAKYNIEYLTAGLYFVNIQSGNGSITKKLIKH